MQVLARAGYCTHAFDYRGHGQSDGRRTHCDRFEQYLDDLEAFLGHVRSCSPGPYFLFGHSLGGLISARWSLGRTDGVAGVVLSSPFLALAFKPPRWMTTATAIADKLVPWLPVPNGLKVEQLTRDRDLQRATDHDPLYLHTATPGWYREVVRAQQEVVGRAADLVLPCLMLVGAADPVADPSTMVRFHEAIRSQDKSLKRYEGMLHEVLNETGRTQVQADVVEWLGGRCPPAPTSA